MECCNHLTTPGSDVSAHLGAGANVPERFQLEVMERSTCSTMASAVEEVTRAACHVHRLFKPSAKGRQLDQGAKQTDPVSEVIETAAVRRSQRRAGEIQNECGVVSSGRRCKFT
jgi:hypothetical protein